MQTASARWSRVPRELCEQKPQLKQRGEDPGRRLHKEGTAEESQGNASDLPVPGGLAHSETHHLKGKHDKPWCSQEEAWHHNQVRLPA